MSTSGNDYITIRGTVNIQGSDIAEHLHTPAKGDENNHEEQMTDLLGFAEADIDILVEKLANSKIDPDKSTDEKATSAYALNCSCGWPSLSWLAFLRALLKTL